MASRMQIDVHLLLRALRARLNRPELFCGLEDTGHVLRLPQRASVVQAARSVSLAGAVGSSDRPCCACCSPHTSLHLKVQIASIQRIAQGGEGWAGPWESQHALIPGLTGQLVGLLASSAARSSKARTEAP
jgi:hypothetical protein